MKNLIDIVHVNGESVTVTEHRMNDIYEARRFVESKFGKGIAKNFSSDRPLTVNVDTDGYLPGKWTRTFILTNAVKVKSKASKRRSRRPEVKETTDPVVPVQNIVA